MNISRDEAQAALDAIEDATNTPRFLLRSWVVSIFVVGVIWTVSFAGIAVLARNPALEHERKRSWSASYSLSIGGRRHLTAIRVAPQSRLAFLHARLAIFYGILYLFFILWQIVLPLTAMDAAFLWITVVMFAAIITGIWLGEPVLIGCGVAVTLLSTLGYWLAPQVFWLWVAIVAGLPLIGVSIYLWRRR